MDSEAVEKSLLHFARAKSAYVYMGPTFGGDISGNWVSIVTAGVAVFTALDIGSKKSRKSELWMSKNIGQLRADPLLSYMRQSRNACEHGVADIVSPGPDVRGEKLLERFVTFETEWTDEGYFVFGTTVDGGDVRLQLTPPDYRLQPVLDKRSGKLFHPPKEHLGRPLKSTTLMGVGRVWLQYLEEMLEQAKELERACL